MSVGWKIELRVAPSFEEGFVICISGATRPKDDDCFVWSERGQSSKLRSTDELCSDAPLRISRSEGSAIYEALRQVSVAAAPPLVAGLDGTTYTLEVKAFFNAVTYRWWQHLPSGWAGLSPIVEQLARYAVPPPGA